MSNALLATFKRAQQIGRYELLAPLGSGGMARIWCARRVGDQGYDELFAIKTLLPHLATDPVSRTLFAVEAEVGLAVSHPNVVRTVESGDHEGMPYLAMEWIHGDSLKGIVKTTGALPPRLVAKIVLEVAKALAGIHAVARNGVALGIVHRDISPDNILISAEGVVKVIDFGVAKTSMHRSKADRELRGKVRYMSPEQLAQKNVDGRADIFSLSCVFYELATGRPPWDGETEVQVMQRLLNGELLLPSRIVDGFPSPLEGILIKAMSEDASFRFSTADQFVKALQAWLDSNGGDIPQSELAAFVARVAGQKLERQMEKIREGETMTGFEAPFIPLSPLRPPLHSMTPSGPSRSGILPVGRRVPKHGYSAEQEQVSVLPTSSGPPSARWNYILAGSVGVVVVLLLTLLALLLRS